MSHTPPMEMPSGGQGDATVTHRRYASTLSIQNPSVYFPGPSPLTDDYNRYGGTPSLLPPPLAYDRKARPHPLVGLGGVAAYSSSQLDALAANKHHHRVSSVGAVGGLGSSGASAAQLGSQHLHLRSMSGSSGSTARGGRSSPGLSPGLLSSSARPFSSSSRLQTLRVRILRPHLKMFIGVMLVWLMLSNAFGEETITMLMSLFYVLIVTAPDGLRPVWIHNFIDPLPYRLIGFMCARHGATMAVLLLEFAVQRDKIMPAISDDAFTPLQTGFIISLVLQIYFMSRLCVGLYNFMRGPLPGWILRVALSAIGVVLQKVVVSIGGGRKGITITGSTSGSLGDRPSVPLPPSSLMDIIFRCKLDSMEEMARQLIPLLIETKSTTNTTGTTTFSNGGGSGIATSSSSPKIGSGGRGTPPLKILRQMKVSIARWIRVVLAVVLKPVLCNFHLKKRQLGSRQSLSSSSAAAASVAANLGIGLEIPMTPNVPSTNDGMSINRANFSTSTPAMMGGSTMLRSGGDFVVAHDRSASLPAFSPVTATSGGGVSSFQVRGSGGGGTGGCCVDCCFSVVERKASRTPIVRSLMTKFY